METRVRVAALIIREGRILLVSAKTRPDHLIPPGGGLEAGETLAEAVEREVGEEAGVEVHCGDLVAYSEVFRAGRAELEFYFTADIGPNPPDLAGVSEENRLVRWIELSALPQTLHFPERLAELSARVEARTPGALYLGRRDLSN